MKDVSTELILSCTKDEVLQDIIASILEREGFKLIKAFNERVIFSFIEEYCPVIVIIDSGIPEIMGYRPWEIIKRINRFKEIKVVLITSMSLQYVDGAYDLADEVIERDFVNDHILSTISKFILHGEDVQGHEDARRLARAIVSDIVYYNSETALRGAADGTFFDLLSREIEEGRILYQSRVPLNILSVSDYYDGAIRDFILKIQQCNLALP